MEIRDGRATLTREELYAQVWTMPMRRLAPTFGLSDVGLKKLCTRHGIPTPPAGYWVKKEFGKHVRQAPLPPRAEGIPQVISLAHDPAPKPEAHRPTSYPVTDSDTSRVLNMAHCGPCSESRSGERPPQVLLGRATSARREMRPTEVFTRLRGRVDRDDRGRFGRRFAYNSGVADSRILCMRPHESGHLCLHGDEPRGRQLGAGTRTWLTAAAPRYSAPIGEV